MSVETKIGVATLVLKNNQILLGRRGQEVKYGAGKWSPPGGSLEPSESPDSCARRELFEETGLIIRKMRIFNWVYSPIIREEEIQINYVSLFYLVTDFEGEVINKEESKCDGWYWFDKNNLPNPLFDSLEDLLKINIL